MDFFTFEPNFLWCSYSEAPCSTEITVSTHGKKHALLIQFSFFSHVYNLVQNNTGIQCFAGKLKG